MKKPRLRSLGAIVAVAAAALVVNPAAAHAAECRSHTQPGITITIGGTPVRVPAIDMTVCVEANVDAIPTPRVDSSGNYCVSPCLAIILDWGTYQPDSGVSLTYSIDGSGDSQGVAVPFTGGWGGRYCYFGVGVPNPPESNCYISIDPDGF